VFADYPRGGALIALGLGPLPRSLVAHPRHLVAHIIETASARRDRRATRVGGEI
jgi:hypothetical protein